MKHLIVLLALVAAGIAQADVIETQTYSTDVGVKFGKVKCSLFGNLKMQLTGLDSRAGWGAKGWMKSGQDFEQKCNAVKKDVVKTVQSRRNSYPADVTLKTITLMREIIRDDRWHDRGPGWPDYPYYTYIQCEKTVTKKLTVVMKDLTVEGQPLILRNEHTRLTDLTYGPCPR